MVPLLGTHSDDVGKLAVAAADPEPLFPEWGYRG
jgi:hypothetical protein